MSRRTPGIYELTMSPTLKRRRPAWGEPGSKCVRRTGAVVFSRGPRAVIVTVYPDGVIGLRLAKHRAEEYVNAADVYRGACLTRIAAAKAAKAKARKGSRRS